MTASVRLNVRSGPGLESQILDTLHTGERVSVDRCQGQWCQITHIGIDGWVYAPYLKQAGFTETWRATSRSLPATLSNGPASDPGFGVGIDLGKAYPCPKSQPMC